jgi:hypothetical protein
MNPGPATNTVLRVVLAFILPLLLSLSAQAQSESSFEREQKIPINILKDQLAIWTSPAHMQFKPMLFVVPIGIASAITAGNDEDIMETLGRDTDRERISGYISHAGTLPVNYGFAGATYAIGKLSGNTYLAETGLLTVEALSSTGILTGITKLAADRKRPIDGGDGTFRNGGNSFFSGHSSLTWTTATVFATRYSHRPLVKYPAYLLAAAISVSRITGHQHFASDVLVGASVGFMIGKYVVHRERNGILSRMAVTPFSDRRTATFAVQISFR